MKKGLLLFALLLTWLSASAQDAEQQQTIDSLKQTISTLSEKNEQLSTNSELERIWKRRKWFTFGYGKTSLDIEDPDFGKLPYKSQAAFSLSWGKTYYLHRKPIANMVKIGLDATWVDINYARYKKGKGLDLPSENDFDGFDDLENLDPDFDPDFDLDDYYDLDLGMHQVEVGMGFGPSVTVTPFYPLGISALNYVKVGAYFHWMPTYSAVIRTKDAESYMDEYGKLQETDSETVLNHGYCNFFRFGLSLSWKALTIGFEHRWGSAKYKTESFDDDEYGYESPSTGEWIETDSPKMKHTTKSNRFFIGFRF